MIKEILCVSAALLLASCASAGPTPQIIYVTPEPPINASPGASTAPPPVGATPLPTVTQSDAPIATPRPTRTPASTPFARLGGQHLLVYGERDNVYVYVIQEVFNEGPTWVELRSFESSWTILDAGGGISETGEFTFGFPIYLAPGQTGYLAEEVYTEVPRDELATLEVDAYYVEADAPNTTFASSDVRIRDQEFGGWEVLGRVTNTSSQQVGQVQVGIVVTDAEGVPLAVDSTYVENLSPGEPNAFQTLGSNAPIDLDGVELLVFVNNWGF